MSERPGSRVNMLTFHLFKRSRSHREVAGLVRPRRTSAAVSKYRCTSAQIHTKCSVSLQRRRFLASLDTGLLFWLCQGMTNIREVPVIDDIQERFKAVRDAVHKGDGRTSFEEEWLISSMGGLLRARVSQSVEQRNVWEGTFPSLRGLCARLSLCVFTALTVYIGEFEKDLDVFD